MGLLPALNTQLVEVIVPAGNTAKRRFNIADQPNLRNKYVDWIETFCVSDVTNSASGNPIITYAAMLNSYITLYLINPQTGEKGEFLNQLPLVSLHRTQATTNAYVRDLLWLNGLFIDWSKSYITLGVDFGINTQVSYLFQVAYRFTPGKGQYPNQPGNR